MKTLKLISAAILLATMQAVGATQYYACDTGSDSNDGLSPDTPIATASKAISIFNAISAGDSVLFCRGGKFTVANDLRIYNPNCQASNPCTLADYQPPSGQLPNLPVLTQTGGTNLFNFQDSGNADHDEGYTIKNLMLTGLGTGTGMFFYNDVDDVKVDSVVFNAFSKGAYEAGSNTPNAGSDAKNERINLANVSFINVTKKTVSPNNGIVVSSSTSSSTTSTSSTSSSSDSSSGALITYYVCDNGNDANTGLSMDKPWQTFEKAMASFNAMKGGSAIAFCRGGKFVVKNATPPGIYNTNCSATNPCRIEDYYPTDPTKKAKPLITNTLGKIFNFQDPSTANKDGGYILKNISIKGGGVGEGVFIFNDVDDLTINNLTIEGFAIGIQSAGSNSTNDANVNGKNDRLIIKNSTIINNYDQGYLGSCNDCVIDGNTFDNNGFAKKILNHNIYFGGKTVKNVTIKNNILHKAAIVDGKCNATSLVVHGIIDGLVIDNNVVYEDIGAITPYCWGISVDNGWSNVEEQFTNVTITNNKVSNVANVAIGCSSCGNVLIAKNTVTSSQIANFIGISVPVREEDTYKSNKIVIKDNNISVLNTSRINGVRVPESTSSYTIQTNIVNYKSNDSICIYPATLALTGGNICNKTN